MSQPTLELRAFHRFVRAAFADHSTRVRLLRASRARRLQQLSRLSVSAAERRWEGEGGSTR